MKEKEFPILVSERCDGLGARLVSLLQVLYLAKKLGNLEFAKFVWLGNYSDGKEYETNWQGTTDQKIIGMSYEAIENIFSKNFIEKFYINGFNRKSSINLMNRPFKTFAELKKAFEQKYKEVFIYEHSDVFSIFSDLNIEEEGGKIAEVFNDIEFNNNVNKVINIAKQKALNLGEFVCLHIRSGDLIYDYADIRKHNKFCILHGTYTELALNIIKNLKGKVILVGDDVTSLREMVKFINRNDVIFIEYFKDGQNYSNLENFFFDIIFMSYAKKIYGTHSNVARIAHYIGNKELINNYEIFSTNEQYEFLKKNYNILDLCPAQKAFSLFHAMILGEENGEENTILISYAKEAIKLDPTNQKYQIYLLKYLLSQDLDLANDKAKEFLKNEEFLNTLFIKHANRFIAYAPLFPNFTETIVSDYPYLSYIASKIKEFQNNLTEAIYFAKSAYKKDPEDKMFKEYYIVLLEKGLINLNQIQAKSDSALRQIHSHLAYKLGSAMIINSKSFLGYLLMPYVLMAITIAHKTERKIYKTKITKNPSLKFPPLEEYPDYQEALKEKECFTYKLGLAFIKANKTWYKGGLLRFFFKDLPRLKRENKRDKKD